MTAPLSPELRLSEQITRDYHILGLLGKGGMGEVFLAEQLRVGRRRVALKILNAEYSANANVIRRFENEAASAGLINHRNVVMIYESRITSDGQIYVAMEYVEGQSLRQMLSRGLLLPLESVVEIIRQSCAGLAAAHKLGIVHRDIKPDNIMIAVEDGAMLIKLLDFGIARLAEPGPTEQHTRAGTIIGTPEYMSPEQASGVTGDRIDARSDIYSLGMVAYEMLTGKVAFEGRDSDSYLALLHRQMMETPKRPSEARPERNIPAAIEEVVLKALAKNRTERPQTAQDFASELLAAWQRKDSPSGRSQNLQAAPEQERATGSVRAQASAQLPDATVVAPVTTQQTPLRAATQPIIPGAGTSIEAPLSPGLLSKWKYPLAAVLAGLIVLAIAFALIPKPDGDETKERKLLTSRMEKANNPPPSVAPTPMRVMDYRIRLKKPVDGLMTLPTDNTVHSWAQIGFEFALVRAGAIYLFAVMNDQSMQWLDARKTGVATPSPAGKILTVPGNLNVNWWNIDHQTGEEKFLVVHVPEGQTWSLAETIAPEKFSVKGEAADLSPAAAGRLRDFLRQNATDLSVTSRQNENAATHSLSAANENRITYYEIRLNHVP
jgi:serine/threonine-protein kinase